MQRQQDNELRKLQLQEARMKIENDRAEKDAYGQIFSGMGAGGAPGGSRPDLGQLARVNPQAAMQIKKYFDGMDDDTRKREVDKYKAAAPLLVRIKQMPYEQRRAFI